MKTRREEEEDGRYEKGRTIGERQAGSRGLQGRGKGIGRGIQGRTGGRGYSVMDEIRD